METSFGELIAGIRRYMPTLDAPELDLFTKAFNYAREHHEGQIRNSGCPYFVHPYEVTRILIELRMDIPTLCAGLLHDVVEDVQQVNTDDIQKEFGKEIAFLVEGVTKLGAIEFLRLDERDAENYRKMVLAMARDVRVIIVKLADRLHNMQTIGYKKEASRRRIAQETLDIYAPLAHRLGIARLRTELEDLAFKALEPEFYKDIAQRVQEKRAEREAYTERLTAQIRESLAEASIKAEVFGRPKHLYSIYQKITQRGVPFESIYDLIGFRVLVESRGDCYLALGVIHDRWMPMPERFKDYIATPKSNGYRSLHTTVLDSGRPVEVQIRTYEMHRIAEFGVASHWRYKEPQSSAPTQSLERFAWLRQLVEQIQEVKNPQEFLQSMRGELYDEEIFVFTPKGDMKVLKKGATPIDFAFSIHSEIGLHATGARVNGHIVPLKSELSNGDIVEIMTEPDARPSRDWLRFVKSPRARTKIKHWLREQEFEQSVQLGRRLIEAELRTHHLTPKNYLKPAVLEDLAKKLGHEDAESFLADVGNGQISPQRVYHTLVPPEEREEPFTTPEPTRLQVVDARLDGIQAVTRVAKCCMPIPGDDVVGFVTRGRGVTIHARDCPRIAGEFERIVPIDWIPSGTHTYRTEIVVESNDRKALLRDVADAIAAEGANIYKADVTTPDSFTALHHFTMDVTGTAQLKAVTNAVARVRGVRHISRRKRG
jgi:GTP pyrophosphokinase